MVSTQFLHEVVQASPYWELEKYTIDQPNQLINLHFKLKQEVIFKCPVCSSKHIEFHREEQREFRYLPLLEYQTYIHAPRVWIVCPEHGSNKIEFPWEEKLAELLRTQMHF